MVSAPLLEGLLLDDLAPSKHRLLAAKERIGGRDVVERLMIANMVVVGDEIGDGLLEFPGKVEGVELDDGFHRAMVALDLALGLWMVGTSVNVVDAIGFQVVGQRLGDESRAVVRQEPRSVANLPPLNSSYRQGELQCLLDIGGGHGRAQAPGENVA